MSHFFRFPLKALAAFEGPLIRLENVVGFCVMDVGYKLVKPLEKTGLTLAECRKVAWERGCTKTNVDSKGKDADQRLHREYQAVQSACGIEAQATVTIRNDWFWSCLEGLRGKERNLPVSYREFSVLCAILSKIGDKELESCTWQEIQCRALGYTTQAAMKAGLATRRDGAQPMSRQVIRTTLDALERCKFFARFPVGNGTRSWLTYFSFKLSGKELEVEATAAWVQRRRRGRLNWDKSKRERQAKLWEQRRQLAETSRERVIERIRRKTPPPKR